jgi:Protein of unknown function (DUF3631)
LNAPTAPSLRDTAAEGRTVLLDTLERWKKKDAQAFAALMDILDAGFRNGGQLVLKQKVGDRWEKQHVPVYAPYAFAGIRKSSLSVTAQDRSHVIEMRRKPTSVKKLYRTKDAEPHAAIVRRELYGWAVRAGRAVARHYESRYIDQLVDELHLNDRAADIWKPIMAVATALNVSFDTLERLKELARERDGDHERDEGAGSIGIKGDPARQAAIIRALLRSTLNQNGWRQRHVAAARS